MAIAFLQPNVWAIDSTTVVSPGALCWFYEPGTTTLQATYVDVDGVTENTNPVQADENGLFGPIFLIPGTAYDIALTDYLGAAINRCDGYSIGPAAATQSDVDFGEGDGYVSAATLGNAASSLITGIIGYTPANVAGDAFVGQVRLNYVSTALNGGLTTDAAGFRGIPLTVRDTDYTFVLDDSGRGARHTSGSPHTYTIPPLSSVAWPVGTTNYARNYTGAGDLTLAPGAGVTLRVAGSATTGSKTITADGECTFTMEADDIWIARGVNIT